MSPDDVRREMRLPLARFDGCEIYTVGCFDQKVTIFAQQLRAFNLAWALNEARVIAPGKRVAVVGCGAAGLSFAAGAYSSGCDLTLFESAPMLMPLQWLNSNRYINPNIYEWPHEDLLAATVDLPLLRWYSGYAGDVARRIVKQFTRFGMNREIKLETQVASIEPNLGEARLTSVSEGMVPEQAAFDVVVLAMGFGRERSLGKIAPVSYWSNDIYGQHDENSAHRNIIVGCGDGGLTDAIRLSLRDFEHRRLEDIARLPGVLKLGHELAEREAGAGNDSEHNSLYVDAPCDSELLKYLRDDCRLRRDTVTLVGKDGAYYRRGASRLNKIILRHLAELGQISVARFEEVFDGGEEDARLKSAFDRDNPRVIVRIGPERPLNALFPDLTPRAPTESGYRLGSQPCFKKALTFRVPQNIKVRERRLLVLAVGAAGGAGGGGSTREIRALEAQAKSLIEERDFKLVTQIRVMQPSLFQLGRTLRLTNEWIEKWEPDVVAVMGAEFFPLLVRMFPFSIFFREAIVDAAGEVPVVFYSSFIPESVAARTYTAKPPADPNVMREIVRAINAGFPDTDIVYIYNPKFVLDVFFLRMLRKAHREMTRANEVSFRLKARWHLSSRLAAWNLKRRARKLAKIATETGAQVKEIYVGRMTVHLMANEHNVMLDCPFLSSYAADIELGAIVGFDNMPDAAGERIARNFVAPLLMYGKSAIDDRHRHITMTDRGLEGSKGNIRSHVQVSDRLDDYVTWFEPDRQRAPQQPGEAP
jgi:hypothetical protein